MADQNEDIKWLYGKLKAKGYNIGSEVEFTSSLANDEDRSWYYDKAVGMGLNVGSKDDFNALYAPSVTTPSPTPSQAQQNQHVGNATVPVVETSLRSDHNQDADNHLSSDAMDANKVGGKAWNPTEQEKIKLSAGIGMTVADFNKRSRERVDKSRRIAERNTPEGRKRLNAVRFSTQLAGAPTQVMGLTPDSSPVSGDEQKPVKGKDTRQSNPIRDEQGPVPYGVVTTEDGQRKTRWLLSDGTVTTDFAEADRDAYRARRVRLMNRFLERMKENGLNPAKKEDIERQSQLDYEAPMRKVLDTEWEKAEEEDRKTEEEYNREVESYNKSMGSNVHAFGPDGMPLQTSEEYGRDFRRSVARKETFNLEALADKVLRGLPGSYRKETENGYRRYFTEHPEELNGRSVEQAAEDAMKSQIYNAVYQRAVESNMPESKTEFFVRKLADQPFVSPYQAMETAAAAQVRSWGMGAADTEAMAKYGEQHRALDITGTVLNMAIDPTTYISGAVGSMAGKHAMRFVGRQMLEGTGKDIAARYVGSTLAGRVIAGAAGGAANFGTFESLKDVQGQMKTGGVIDPETGEQYFSMGSVLNSGVHGLGIGAVTGAVSPLIGNVADKVVKSVSSTGGKMAARGGELLASTVAEGTVFSIPEWMEGDKDAFDVWTDNMAMMAGFKLSHAIKTAPSVINSLRPVKPAADRPLTREERIHNNKSFTERLRERLDKSPSDVSMNDDEREELRNKGYGELSELFTYDPDHKSRKVNTAEGSEGDATTGTELSKTVDYEAKPKEDGNLEFDGYASMERLMEDSSVSEATRAKAYYIFTGRMLPMSTVTGYNTEHNEDGSVTVSALNHDGGVITSRTFSNDSKAAKEVDRIQRQAELNTIDIGEQYRNAEAQERVMEAAINEVSPGADPRTVYNIYEAVRRGDKNVTEEQRNLADIIDEAIERNSMAGDEVSPAGIRERIAEETGVDIDMAIRKEPGKRSDDEQEAVKRYAHELFPKEEWRKPREEQQEADRIYEESRQLYGRMEQGEPDARAEFDAISVRMEEANRLCEDAFGDEAEFYMAQIRENPWGILDEPSLRSDQRDAVLYYINANVALEGVLDASNEKAADKRQKVEGEVSHRTHKERGMIVPATMKDDEKPVYIIKGDVVMYPDGSGVDVRNSSDAVIILDESGKYKFTSPNQIDKVGDAIDPENELRTAYDIIDREQEEMVGTAFDDTTSPEGSVTEREHEDGNGPILPDHTQETEEEENPMVPTPANVEEYDQGYEDGTNDVPSYSDEQLTSEIGKLRADSENLTDYGRGLLEAMEYEEQRRTLDAKGEPVPTVGIDGPLHGTPEGYVDVPEPEKQSIGYEQSGNEASDETVISPSALSKVPVDPATGDPMLTHENVDAQTAWEAAKEFFGSPDDAMSYVRSAVSSAESEIVRAEKAVGKIKPTGGMTKYREDLKNARQKVDGAKSVLAKWKAIADIEDRRIAEEKARIEAENAERLEKKKAEREEMAALKKIDAAYADVHAEVKDYPDAVERLKKQEPEDILEAAAIVVSSNKLLWGDAGGSKGVSSEVGFKEGERKGLFPIFASKEKGGKSIARLAEDEMKQVCDTYRIPYDNGASRDAIIEIISQARTPSDISRFIRRRRMDQAREIAEGEIRREQEAMEEWSQEAYHMSADDYTSYREMNEQEVSFLDENFDDNDYNGNIADEINRILSNQDENIFSRRASGNDSEGESIGNGGGYEVLSPEQSFATERGAEDSGQRGIPEEDGGGELYQNETLVRDSSRTDPEIIQDSSEELLAARIEVTDNDWVEGEGDTPIYKREIVVDGKHNVTQVDTPDEKGVSTGSAYEYDGKTFGDLREVVSYIDNASSGTGGKLAEARKEVNTEPTEAQKEAGNYKKGHVTIGGMRISIENPRDSVRRGKDADGKEWETKMTLDYGYIRGTTGKDKDHIDIFLSDVATDAAHLEEMGIDSVYVIDQYNKDGSFDEHKVVYGVADSWQAKEAYLENYSPDWAEGRRIDVTETSMDAFKKWAFDGKRKMKPFAEYKAIKALTEDAAQTPTNVNAEGMVVDGEGNSLTLYHGTPNDVAQMSDLELGHARKGETEPARYNGNGISFTPNKDVAVDYASDGKGNTGKVFDANIRLKNPYYTVGVANFTPEEAAEFTASLQAKGHDGIINYASNAMREMGAEPNEVIVFDIKSAVPVKMEKPAITETRNHEKDSIHDEVKQWLGMKGLEPEEASRSAVMRYFKIDYNRAGRILDAIVEEQGRSATSPEGAVTEQGRDGEKEPPLQQVNVEPDGYSEFGPVFTQFRGNAQEAIKVLSKLQDGEAIGALHHKDIGEIDLVWGKAGTAKSDGWGLAKLIKYHPEVVEHLQEILGDMHITQRSENRINLESDTHKAAVRLTWNSKKKKWLLTAFEKKETSEPIGKTTDTDDNRLDLRGDTALSQNSDVSADKDNALSPDKQADGKESSGGYSITPSKYTNKKGKTSDVWHVKFDRELGKEEKAALNSFIREPLEEGRKTPRGWYDRNEGTYVMRSEEGARRLGEMIDDEEAVADAQPMTAEELREVVATAEAEDKKTVRKPVEPKIVPTNRVGIEENSPSDKPTDAEQKKDAGHEISDDEMQSLADELRDLLGIGEDEGNTSIKFRDPGELTPQERQRIQSAGIRFAMGLIERGTTAFPEYATKMVGLLGDKIRPWLKSFYEGARWTPGYDKYTFTPTEEVGKFDVQNFDKKQADPIAQAAMIVEENKAATVSAQAQKELIETRNKKRKEDGKQREADTATLANEAEVVAGEAEVTAESATDERAIADASEKLDKALDKINLQLAILGYFKDEGKIAKAEEKAAKAGAELASRLMDEMGLTLADLPQGVNVASADFDDNGGYVRINLPVRKGYEPLKIDIQFDRTDSGALRLTEVMSSLKRGDELSYIIGEDHVAWLSAPRYEELLGTIREQMGKYLPKDTEAEPKESGTIVSLGDKPAGATDKAATTGQAAEVKREGKGRKSRTKNVTLRADEPVGGLFADIFDEPETPKANEKRNGNKPSQEVAGGKRPHPVGNNETGTDGRVPSSGTEPIGKGGAVDEKGAGVERGADGATHGTDEDRGIQPRLGNRGRNEGDVDGGSTGAAVERGGTAGEGSVPKRGTDGGAEGISEGEPASKSGRGGGSIAVKKPKKPEVRYTRNFRYDEAAGNEADTYTPSERLEANVKAIETVADVLFGDKPATDEQRTIMSRFRGWGQVDLGKYYDIDHILRNTYSHSPINRLAKAIQKLDPQGEKKLFDAIKRASLSSYYTPTPIARAMNTFLGLAGYKGGSLLDPSMGNGMFEGTLPKSIQERTAITGVELDWLSGQLSRALYPDANVIIGGFEKSGLAAGSFDVVTSNVPFGDIVVNDPTWKNDSTPLKRSAQNRIHNYYAVKMLEATRPGGLVAMLTTSAVMDTPSNQNIRAHIADQGEILGAIRLPDNTFQGTGVVTDMLFIRKWRDDQDRAQTREDSAYRELEKAFLSSYEVTAPNKQDGKKEIVQLNGYFGKNPRNLIGKIQAGNQYGKRDAFGLTSDMTVDEIASEVEKAIKRIVGSRRGSIFNPTRTIREVQQSIREAYKGDGDWVSNGNLVIQDGKVGIMTSKSNEYGESERIFEGTLKHDKMLLRIKGMIDVRTAMKKLIAAQIEGAKEVSLKAMRTELQKAYDTFVGNYGRLQDKANAFILDDIDGYTLQALEVWKSGKFVGLSDIFTKNSIKPALKLDGKKTPQEAVALSLAEYGYLRPDYLEKALGEKWADQCGDFVFLKPNSVDDYATRDEYLSGDVVTKLAEARAAAEKDKSFERNVKALEEVQPERIPFDDIAIHLGARWIPEDILNDFVNELFGLHAIKNSRNGHWDSEKREYVYNQKSGVRYIPEIDSFEINIEKKELGGAAQDWETPKKSAKEILQAALEDKTMLIKYKDKDGNEHIDEEQTELANQKIADLRERFESWLPSDPERVDELEQSYNNRFNRTVIRHFDGSHLVVPGLMGKELRPHQKDAVWMLINNRGGIVDHIVGAGKTLVMQSAIMEMRRMGIAKKPLIVALKSTVAQIAREFKESFPSARVLAPNDGDFQKENRKKFIANISLNDYDCIILSHEQYCMLPHTEEAERAVIDEQLWQLNNIIEYLYGTDDKSQMTKRQIKALEKRRNNLVATLEKRLDRNVDREFCFENLGIDYMFVDESHQFKSLPYVTSYQKVAGLGETEGSSRAIALLTGIRHLQRMHQGDKGTVFLSGTTITNSLVEIYNLLNYLRPRKLEELGMPTFDAWASVFAVHSSELEAGVTGTFAMKDRFRSFDNVPELSQLYAEIADVRNDTNLKLPKPAVDGRTVIVPASSAMQEINSEIVKMIENKNGSYFGIHAKDANKRPWGLDASTLSAKAAVSPRLIFPDMEDDGGKVHAVCENVKKYYDEMADQRGVQLIFCEMGVPDKTKKYDAYTDMVNRFVNDYGIPRSEIAYIQEANSEEKRKDLFQRVRDGKVRILIGGTKNMGTGVNVQDRITDMHMLTVPWTPSALEQCIGRGARQGNFIARDFMDNKVRVHYYATEGSLDLYKYQLLDAKGKMFTQFKMGTVNGGRSFDEGSADEDGNIDPAEMVAILSGNPVIFERAKQEKVVKKLRALRNGFERDYQRKKAKQTELQARQERLERLVRLNERDQADLAREGFKPDDKGVYPSKVTIMEGYSRYGGRTFDKPKEAGEYLLKMLEDGKDAILHGFGQRARVVTVNEEGSGGLFSSYRVLQIGDGEHDIKYTFRLSDDPTAAGTAFRNLLKRIIDNGAVFKRDLDETKKQLAGMNIGDGVFPKQAQLDDAIAKFKELNAEYNKLGKKPDKPTTEDGSKYRDGDEMSDGERLRAIRELEPIEIERNGMSREELREVYNNLPTVDKDGMEIEFYRSAFKKIYKEGGLFGQVVPVLDEVLGESVLAYSEDDNLGGTERADGTMHKAHPNIIAFDNYVGKVIIDGKEYYIRTTVERGYDGRNGTHSFFVTGVDIYEKTADFDSSPGYPRATETNGVERAIGGTDSAISRRPKLPYDGVVDAKLQQFFERASSEANILDMRDRAEELSDKLHFPVRVISDGMEMEEMTEDGKPRYSRRERRAKGWWSAKDDEVVIVLPNHVSVADVENTVVHEIVGHKGLRAFIGEERFDEFLGEIYGHASNSIRKVIDKMTDRMVDEEADRLRVRRAQERERAGEDVNANYYTDMADARVEAEKKREDFRKEATEEYMADLGGRIGDEGFTRMSQDELTLWGKVKAKVQAFLDKFLRGLKIAKSIRLTDKDLSYILFRSWKNAKERHHLRHRGLGTYDKPADAAGRGGVFSEAEDAVMRHKTRYDADAITRFRDPDMGLEETITKMKADAMQANANDLQAKRDAMRAIGGNLNHMRSAMARQKEYDISTVKSVSDLALVLMDANLLDNMSKYETKRILGAIDNVVGKEDVSRYVEKVIDIMVDNQLRKGANDFGSLLRVKGSHVDARGVEVQGALDPEGQTIAQVARRATTRTREDIETMMGEALNRMGSPDKAVADVAMLEYAGLQIAHRYAEEVRESKAEEKDLSASIKEAQEEYKRGNMTHDAYLQYKKATEDAIRQNKIERAEAYRSLTEQLGGVLGESVERAKAWREAQKQRVEEIHHNANSDMEGRVSDEHHKEDRLQKLANNSAVRFLLAPLGTFDQMLRMFGRKSVRGEGYLWNRYMRGWVDCTEREYTGYKEALKTLDKKVSEVFGKDMKWGDLFSMERGMPKGTVGFWDGGEKREHELTQGNLLYIYMADKMTDGRMKLRAMGITDEDVERIKDFVDPRFIELADWMQEEFLVEKRNEYNEVHKRMFGASMAAIENYFPLKILANARMENVDVADDTGDTVLPATSTGSIIKRRRNNLALDVTGADAFSVILDHIQQMERWSAFAEYNRDLNTLLSYKRFRNQVMNMTSAYGAGKTLWTNFRNVAAMAAGAYRPPIAPLDKAAVNIAKGVTAAKVSFRLFTALKQFASMPAYLADCNPLHLATNLINPMTAWKWSMENLPLFEKRWKSRMAGDPRLLKSDMDWKMWRSRVVEIAGRVGMSPNAFVDALTVAIGARSMYQTKKAKYLRWGMDEEAAEKRAKQDATILFNQTQQSSEGAFLSTMQADRSWLSVLFTVFRNSSMSYSRQLYDALRNIGHRLTPGFKGITEEFMAKQMRRDGIDPDKADRNAKQEYRRGIVRDLARVAVFGYALQLAWNLFAYLPYLIFGDDDDEKDKMWDDVFTHTMFGSIEGLTGGDVMSAAGNMWKRGDGNAETLTKDMPLASDVTNILRKMDKDYVAAMNDVINLLVQSGLGVNPQSLTDAVVAVMDYSEGDMAIAREMALCIMRVLNCPQSQTDKIYFDEIEATGEEASRMAPEEIAERYAEYKLHRNAPLTGWAYGDESREKALENHRKRALTTMKERLNQTMATQRTRELLDSFEEVSARERELNRLKKSDREAWRKGVRALRESTDMRRHNRVKRYDHDMKRLTERWLKSKTPEESDSIIKLMTGARDRLLEETSNR